MNDLIDFIDLRLNIFRRECQQQVCSHSLFAVETFRRCQCLQGLRRGHNVIRSTEARTTKDQLSSHHRVLKRKLLRDKATNEAPTMCALSTPIVSSKCATSSASKPIVCGACGLSEAETPLGSKMMTRKLRDRSCVCLNQIQRPAANPGISTTGAPSPSIS